MMAKLVVIVFAMLHLEHIILVNGSSDKKPHPHRGLLQPFDGKPIPYSINENESFLLNSGKPVIPV